MALRVLHLSTYDANGGAARAAYSLHKAMGGAGVESRMHVARKQTTDPTVSQGPAGQFAVAQQLDRALWRLQRSPVRTWRSPARFGSVTARRINASSADIVHLHWVTDGFLSVETIGQIAKPIVWSMYDMWPFTGTEHYCADGPHARWLEGYLTSNRPSGERGFDLDRWTFNRKLNEWSSRANHFLLVPASTRLAKATASSALMGAWPIASIPHVVDDTLFAPMDRHEARLLIGLPPDRPTILFVASAGIRDQRKGFDLLEAALPAILAAHPGAQVAIVGPAEPDHRSRSGAALHWLGQLPGDAALRIAYCAADVLAVPSREDNMPLTAMEAHTCGRAVAAFNIGGLPDIVRHGSTGHLAEPFDTASLGEGINQALTLAKRGDPWGEAARRRAMSTWSPDVVVDQYLELYRASIA